MGVMACQRDNCEEIMFDRHSNKHGYICEGCFDELCALGPEADIEKFMDSKKIIENAYEKAYFKFNVEFPFD